MIENSFKTTLSFSPLQCKYLGKNHFKITRALSEKKKLKSGYLELRFSVYTQKSVCATNTRPFGEVGGNPPLQLSSRTHFAKIEDKKVIAKN